MHGLHRAQMRLVAMAMLVMTFVSAGYLANEVRADDAGAALDRWISKINAAASSVSYDGVFVYIHSDQIETMRVVHQNTGDAISERIFSLSGAPREVIRDNNQVWCYLPDQKMGVHDYRQGNNKNFPRLLSGDGNELSNHYQLKKLADDRVADRAADVVAIMPLDAHRYGYKLWVDKQTGLLLGANLVDKDRHKILEQYMFVTLKTDDAIDVDSLKPRTARSDLKWFGPAPADSVLDNPVKVGADDATDKWSYDSPPKGFTLTEASTQISSVTSRALMHFIFTDGLATVSVFVDSKEEGQPQQSHVNHLEGGMLMGAMSAYGRQVSGHYITAVGEVPLETVRRIAESMRLK